MRPPTRLSERRPAQRAVSVSLFPFLAVLICTMGALILLLVVIARQARVSAALAAEEETSKRREQLSIERENVAVIFPNAGSDPRIVQAVASEAGIRVGDPLYIDALGPEGSGADTYAGMMRTNVRALVAGMRG